ncbi:MAG: hypothetical protein KF822_12485 [Steroidobacteraceae bacterium]|nr:hypothetical protein [Steroidobacteraceae bacterium]
MILYGGDATVTLRGARDDGTAAAYGGAPTPILKAGPVTLAPSAPLPAPDAIPKPTGGGATAGGIAYNAPKLPQTAKEAAVPSAVALRQVPAATAAAAAAAPTPYTAVSGVTWALLGVLLLLIVLGSEDRKK